MGGGVGYLQTSQDDTLIMLYYIYIEENIS